MLKGEFSVETSAVDSPADFIVRNHVMHEREIMKAFLKGFMKGVDWRAYGASDWRLSAAIASHGIMTCGPLAQLVRAEDLTSGHLNV